MLLTAFDLLLIAVSLIVFLAGLEKLKNSWRMGRREECHRGLKGFWGYLLGHGKILQNPRTGLAHVLVFWGFLFSLLMGVLPQFGLSLPPFLAGTLSLMSDLFGTGLFFGLLFFLSRRLRSYAQPGPKRVILPVALLHDHCFERVAGRRDPSFHHGNAVELAYSHRGVCSALFHAAVSPFHADHDSGAFLCSAYFYSHPPLFLHGPSDFRKPECDLPAKRAPRRIAGDGS